MEVQNPNSTAATDVRRHLGMLWRAKWLIAVAVVVAGGLAFAVSARHEDLYQASGELLVFDPPELDLPVAGASLSDEPSRRIENELELIESREIQEAVDEEVGHHVDVEATNAGSNDVIQLSATSTDARGAADEVNDFAEAYAALRTADAHADLRQARERTVRELRAAQTALTRLRRPLEEVDARIAGTPPGPERDALLQDRDTVLDRIGPGETSLSQQIGEYQNTLATIDNLLATNVGGIRVITTAYEPLEPFYPQPKKDALVGASIGLLLGLALAFGRDLLRDTLANEDDLERTLPGDPLLGIIPDMPDMTAQSQLAILDEDDHSVGTEAYRTLAASVEFARLGKPVAVIHVTSPMAGEGKSTTAANLAAAFAETGTRVVVIDADLRRPTQHRFFSASNEVGLSALLTGRVQLEEALQDIEGHANLKLLSPGPLPPNPTTLLYARRTEDLFAELRAAFDVVVIDSPPVLPVADTLILTQFADLVLLVVRANSTGRRMLRRARKSLGRVEVGMVATVLNGVRRTGPDGYDYYYGRYHEAEAQSRGRRRLSRRS